MKVVIYGLYEPYFNREDVKSLDGERWVLNDYYQFGVDFVPDRIYNLHVYPHVHLTDKSRFSGDWKDIYNQAAAEVITVEKIEGVHRQRVIDTPQLVNLAGERPFLSCSIATMIYHALLEGYDDITVVGVKLNNSEHAYQAVGIIRAIMKARELGAKASMMPMGVLTDIQKRLEMIPPMGLCGDTNDWTYWEWQTNHVKLRLDENQLEISND